MSKSVRTIYMEFMEKTGMSHHEFARRSDIPRSTLYSIEEKEDYEVREKNIRKMAKGMGVSLPEFFSDDSTAFCLYQIDEIDIIENFRRLSDRQKGWVEGYIKALIDENDNANQTEQ